MSDVSDSPPAQAGPDLSPGEGSAPEQGLCLVLGGGGFKGLAHIGVLLELERAGIPVRSIVGTSAGALMGATYSHFGKAEDVRDLVCGFVGSDAFQRKGFVGFHGGGGGAPSLMSRLLSGIKRQVALERMFRRSSAFGGAALRYVVRSLVPNVRIENLPRPVAVAALDLVRGEEVLLTEGPLCSAVCGSSSVPGFFPPVERQGLVLVDAGIVNNLPTRAARSLGALRVVAVDLSAGLAPVNGQRVGMDVLLRAQDISTSLANRRWSEDADIVLYPDLGGRSWLDPRDPEGIIEAGVVATRAALPDLQALAATSRLGRP